MKRLALVALVLWLVAPKGIAQNLELEGMLISPPDGWELFQDALSDETRLAGYANGDDVVFFYVKPAGSFEMKSVFASQASVLNETTSALGPFNWNLMELRYQSSGTSRHLTAFSTEYNGFAFFGFARSSSAQTASANATSFLERIRLPLSPPLRSLTGPEYQGKKYYLGWGAAGAGDPSMMHNEVKYDVLHTHDIFTKEIGGNYIGTKLIGSSVNGSQIRSAWEQIKRALKPEDMFVQYSSGHGSPSGLAVGVSYNDIRDNALSMAAKEIVIFIMACHSGGLVEAFNQKKSVWENWQKQGRTLFVMASSKRSETSATGPGKDPEEPNAPNGSAGSAFGHALWKALIGHADGKVDGVKDGFLSLEEIRDYSVEKTKKVGGHTPVHTGAYRGSLVMNRVPPKAFLERFQGGTEGLSDEQVAERVRALDEAMRVGGR